MALQDDIFDLQHVLEGKPEAKGLDRLLDKLYELEIEDSQRPRVRSEIAWVVRACLELGGELLTLEGRPTATRATQVLWATKALREHLDKVDEQARAIVSADETART